MKIIFFLIVVASVSSLIVFAYMSNKHAKRLDSKRNKLGEKTETIIEQLQQHNTQ